MRFRHGPGSNSQPCRVLIPFFRLLTMISCIIPSRDRARFLPRALDSVISQADAGAIEIVVVDDGSVDATADLLAHRYPQVRCIQTGGVGPGAARNRGAAIARGEILMFLDSDDRWLPGHAHRLRLAMAEGDAAYGVTRNIDDTGGDEFLVPEPGQEARGDCFSALCRWCFIMTSALAVRKRAFMDCGGFPEDMGSLGEDWGFFLRLARRVHLGYAGRVPVSERILHKGSICARVSRDRLTDMYRNLGLVVLSEKGENKGLFERTITWLSETEEDRCLSVQQWYRLMNRGELA